MYRLSLILRFFHFYLSHLWFAVLPKALEPYIIGVLTLKLLIYVGVEAASAILEKRDQKWN